MGWAEISAIDRILAADYRCMQRYHATSVEALALNPADGNFAVRGVPRKVMQLGKDRIVAFLNPDWLSLLPGDTGDYPRYSKELFASLKRNPRGVPVYGRIEDRAAMQQVSHLLKRAGSTLQPLTVRGQYVRPEGHLGCLCAYELGVEGKVLQPFIYDWEFLCGRERMLDLS